MSSAISGVHCNTSGTSLMDQTFGCADSRAVANTSESMRRNASDCQPGSACLDDWDGEAGVSPPDEISIPVVGPPGTMPASLSAWSTDSMTTALTELSEVSDDEYQNRAVTIKASCSKSDANVSGAGSETTPFAEATPS
jgi:hypothetical protein